MPEVPIEEILPDWARRSEPADLPEVSEPEIVRHYNGLSKKNFDLDTGFYPLGSCTMKHNPKLHERVAALPGHARLHPLQDAEYAQGALELMHNLQGALAEIAGLPHVSLQPSAGSHGELAGLLLTRAYHEDRGESRHKVLTPDTAHGTNPATVTMAGYEVVKVGTDEEGGVDIDDLRAKADDDVACLMLTNPNTLGLFDRNIEEIASIVHGVGAHALLRRGQPQRRDGHLAARRHGLRHRPLQPAQDLHPAPRRRRAGRRARSPARTGSSRSCRCRRWCAARRENGGEPRFELDHDRPKSIGKMRGFQGNFGVFVRSYAYICSLGGDGLREVSETAVLNANYLRARLAEEDIAKYLPIAFDRICMHEFVLSGRGARDQLGIKTLDIAKRMLDHEVHPPTVYFPLLVDEALMIEPTETEPKERLDHFTEVVRSILQEAEKDPEVARNAPYDTPVRRLDEAGPRSGPSCAGALAEVVARWARAPTRPGCCRSRAHADCRRPGRRGNDRVHLPRVRERRRLGAAAGHIRLPR